MDTLSQTFSALADPTRRAILARLATGAATVGEIADPFDMSLPAVSRHLKVLTDAGLIERQIEEYRRFREQQFDKLEAYLKRTAPQSKGKSDGRKRRS